MLYCGANRFSGLILQRYVSTVRVIFLVAAIVFTSSCTILAGSPYLRHETRVPRLAYNQALLTTTSGEIPYQKWRIPPWNDDMRYCWMVGDYDFRKFDNVEIILYFHGMHSKDYYRDFRRQLAALKAKRPERPFLFVGFVDTPYFHTETRDKERWSSLVPNPNRRPARLFKTINRLYRAFHIRFPHIKKAKTTLALTGFSGGGRVLDSVGNWLAGAPKDDPYAEAFRAKLIKIVYFDCWFDKHCLETVPTLLKDNPDMKIVGTVHMKEPLEHAVILADKYKMKADKQNRKLTGLNGRLTIFKNDSHWHAMICRLKEAL
jgi:hypothetical protein